MAAFVSQAERKVGKREIARAFGIRGGDRIRLKEMLKGLEEDGVVERRRTGMRPAGRLPPVMVADVTGRDRDGELVAEPEEWTRPRTVRRRGSCSWCRAPPDAPRRASATAFSCASSGTTAGRRTRAVS